MKKKMKKQEKRKRNKEKKNSNREKLSFWNCSTRGRKMKTVAWLHLDNMNMDFGHVLLVSKP